MLSLLVFNRVYRLEIQSVVVEAYVVTQTGDTVSCGGGIRGNV
jgi:hypothetical protein